MTLRSARVTFESRYIWDAYHSDGVEREVQWQIFTERTEQDTYRCLAWLYDGFEFPGVESVRSRQPASS